MGYNRSIQTTTGFKSFELIFGHTNSSYPEEISAPKQLFTEYEQNETYIYDQVQKKL